MTKPWKLKTNSSNILLVLIILLLIKAEWTSCESDESRLENRLEENSNGVDDVRIIEGNDEIARYLFKSSAQNNSLVLDNLMRCIESIRFVTCLKMLLLNRIDDAIEILESPALAKADLFFMNGLLAFKMKNDSDDGPAEGNENSEDVNLDREISQKVVKMFRNRCLQINLFSVYRIDISPVAGTKQDNFIRFGYKIYKGESANRSNLIY